MKFLRWVLALTLFFLTGSLSQAFLLARSLRVTTASIKWMTAFTVGGLAVLLTLAVLVATWTTQQETLLRWLKRSDALLHRIQPVHTPLLAFLVGLYPFLILGPMSDYPEVFFWHALLFWLFALSGAMLLNARWSEKGWLVVLGTSVLIFGVGYKLATFIPNVKTHPFSLTWSEASRYYYASLFLSDSVYGVHINPSVLHPSRYLMQSVPFLLPNSSLWLHRLWQVALWIGTNFLAAALLIRRLSLSERHLRLIMGLWAFLFLFQGPVFYHLLLIVIIILWGFDSQRFWKSLAVVLVASVWGGISRINWVPLPGVLAASLYLLERDVKGQPIWHYMIQPVIWVSTGSLTGLLAQGAYAVLSGNELVQFSSSLTSELLWYRLLPSATNPLGVLPAILLASAPILLLIAQGLKGQWRQFHLVRVLGLGAALLVYFAGGLVVSTKIGGGSNLHNLDGYLTLLMVIGAYIVFDKVPTEHPPPGRASLQPHWALLGLAVMIPVGFAISQDSSFSLPDDEDTQRALETIQQAVAEVARSGEAVLFIAERQLVTFGIVEGTMLIPEYEKVFLMEMAMSGNENYLDQFNEDLNNHRFSLIVTSPQRLKYQDSSDDFGEENNVWVKHVSVPILCYYEESLFLKDVQIQLLVPNPSEQTCPGLALDA